MGKLNISIIVPVFDRPQELKELLDSMLSQTCQRFEVLVIDDGSVVPCQDIVSIYQSRLAVRYFYKSNSGPGASRNFGMARASGNYFVFVDSDCVLPENYIASVYAALAEQYVDAFGGPDSGHDGFTLVQRAINYSMTSFWTTGGIRGGGERFEKFHPRSFNMGFSKEVFERTGGFPDKGNLAGEDIELSIGIMEQGFQTALFKDAFVYHKRRVDFKQFFKQIHSFGHARISISQRHPQTLKLVHLCPMLFTLAVPTLILLGALFSCLWFLPLLFYATLLWADATLKNASAVVGLLAVFAGFVQLGGYGLGFLQGLMVWAFSPKDSRAKKTGHVLSARTQLIGATMALNLPHLLLSTC